MVGDGGGGARVVELGREHAEVAQHVADIRGSSGRR
jgi:hypothetical protein